MHLLAFDAAICYRSIRSTWRMTRIQEFKKKKNTSCYQPCLQFHLAVKSTTSPRLPGNKQAARSQPCKTKKKPWVLRFVRNTYIWLEIILFWFKTHQPPQRFAQTFATAIVTKQDPRSTSKGKHTFFFFLLKDSRNSKPGEGESKSQAGDLHHQSVAFTCWFVTAALRQKILKWKKKGRRFRTDLQPWFHVSATD